MNELRSLLDKLSEDIAETEEKFAFDFNLEYPIEIHGIKKAAFVDMDFGAKKGDFVAIRPCRNECKGKTFLGLYLGDLPLEYYCMFEKETKLLHIRPSGNPAIFVFDLNDIVWGCESWWGKIKDENHLRQITDDDIQNIWYVKALKQIEKANQSSEPIP